MRLFVAGIDEAGRGPLAGPVTAACVVLKPKFTSKQITDSKKITKRKREELYPLIIENSEAYSIVSVGPRRIDNLNILQATKLAMQLAAKKVKEKLNKDNQHAKVCYLVDGNMKLDCIKNYESIIKGDSKVLSIAAASILAKVSRDGLMQKIDGRYPEYEISKHMGYPTKAHKEKVALHGVSAVHRKSFSGVKEFL